MIEAAREGQAVEQTVENDNGPEDDGSADDVGPEEGDDVSQD
jgi:hypothetical protein